MNNARCRSCESEVMLKCPGPVPMAPTPAFLSRISDGVGSSGEAKGNENPLI